MEAQKPLKYKNIFICVLRMNNCTVGLEQHENE